MLILLFMGITLFQPQEPVSQTDLKILEDKIQNKIDSQKNDVNAMWNGLDKRVSNNEWFSDHYIPIAFGTLIGILATMYFITNLITEKLKTYILEEVKKSVNEDIGLVELMIKEAKTQASIFKTEKILVISENNKGESAMELKILGFEAVTERDVTEFENREVLEEDYDLVLFDTLQEETLISVLTPLKGHVYHAFTTTHYKKLTSTLKKKLNLSTSHATLMSNILDTARYRRHKAFFEKRLMEAKP